MEEIDVQRYVLPALLALLILGAFMIIVTNGGSDEPAGAVDRPARSTPTTTHEAATKTPHEPDGAPRRRRAASSRSRRATRRRRSRIAPGISTERLLELNPSVDPAR